MYIDINYEDAIKAHVYFNSIELDCCVAADSDEGWADVILMSNPPGGRCRVLVKDNEGEPYKIRIYGDVNIEFEDA